MTIPLNRIQYTTEADNTALADSYQQTAIGGIGRDGSPIVKVEVVGGPEPLGWCDCAICEQARKAEFFKQALPEDLRAAFDDWYEAIFSEDVLLSNGESDDNH
jgi:hypothetical protein